MYFWERAFMISARFTFDIQQFMRALNDKKHTNIHSLNLIFGAWYDFFSE